MIATNDIQNAQREAAMDRAHEMCIDKIAELSEQNKQLKDALNRISKGIYAGAGKIARNALNN